MLDEHGKEFLGVAEHLLQQGNHREAFFRSAISRAYYAAFNYVLFVLRQGRVEIPFTGQAHVKLPQCLQNSTNDILRSIGRIINDLKKSRRKADYELGVQITRKKTQDTINDANMVISEFNRYFEQLDSNEKNDILDKMKRFLRENPSS
jgi:uncharacterized protein (UPF0332 family)